MKSGFWWGAATSAFQIEGARDSRGDSTWDQFCETPGKIAGGHNGDHAARHFEFWREDLDLLRLLGANSYRFSISWPRIFPNGASEVGAGGLEFYDRLVDGLLERGIEPLVNLFHWEIPLWVKPEESILNGDFAKHFGDYAGVVAGKLGDRVKHWMTMNEPNCLIGDGFGGTVHAPGYGWTGQKLMQAQAGLLDAHHLSCSSIRKCCSGAQITVALAGTVVCPVDPTAEESAYQATFALDTPTHWSFSLYADPIYSGEFPTGFTQAFGFDPPQVRWSEESIPDFTTLNLYSGTRYTEGGLLKAVPGAPASAVEWPVVPEILYWGPKFFERRYGKPILIGENGLASMDWVTLDGDVPDHHRIDFIRRHLIELKRAVDDGVNVIGYHHWSLLDNFEWQEGYRKRFGLVHVDYETFKRTPKASFFELAKLIKSNGIGL